eukprot:SAG11_NODE_27942_length_327_cov_0.521930_1_plen_80_part_01
MTCSKVLEADHFFRASGEVHALGLLLCGVDAWLPVGHLAAPQRFPRWRRREIRKFKVLRNLVYIFGWYRRLYMKIFPSTW